MSFVPGVVPKKAEIGTNPGFGTGVGAEFGGFRNQGLERMRVLHATDAGPVCVSLRTFARAVGDRARGSVGSAGAVGIWRKGGRVLVDGHFSARTAAALSPPPVCGDSPVKPANDGSAARNDYIGARNDPRGTGE